MNTNVIRRASIGVLGIVIDLVLAPVITLPLWKSLSEYLHSSLATGDLGWADRAALIISDVGSFGIFVVLIGFVIARMVADHIPGLSR